VTSPVQDGQNYRVVKRKIGVRILLTDKRVIDGEFYAAEEHLNGQPGTVLDRLRDPREKYLPLAADDRHVMLSKAQIVTVRLKEDDVGRPQALSVSEFRILIDMTIGPRLEASFFALSRPARARVLDHLNYAKEAFFPIFQDDCAILVNANHVVAVAEQTEV